MSPQYGKTYNKKLHALTQEAMYQGDHPEFYVDRAPWSIPCVECGAGMGYVCQRDWFVPFCEVRAAMWKSMGRPSDKHVLDPFLVEVWKAAHA